MIKNKKSAAKEKKEIERGKIGTRYIYIYIYILSSTDRLFRSIRTLQCG